MKVIETLWFNGFKGSGGIVLGEEDNTHDPVAYIGVVEGHDEKIDTKGIVAWGSKLDKDTALRIHNHLSKERRLSMVKIHGQIMKETVEELAAGGGSEFPLESDFIQTVGGPLSMQEILILIYQEFKDKPFIITVEPSEVEPKLNRYVAAGVSDQLHKR